MKYHLAIAACLLVKGVPGDAWGDAPGARAIVACVHEPPIAIPDNKLLHFESPIRVPNTYFVVFKCDKALANYVSDDVVHRRPVLPETLPTTAQNCMLLATAYAARFGGKVGGCWYFGGFRSFLIRDISEAAVAELAQDDRIEYVEPDMVATTQ